MNINNSVTDKAFTEELYRRLEKYAAECEEARSKLSRNFGLFQSIVRLWEDETGKQVPDELLRRAGMGRPVMVSPVPVPTTRPLTLENLSVPEAVFELMKEIDKASHSKAIIEKLVSRGYNPKVKDLKARVRTALTRGTSRNIYKRVAPNTFQFNADYHTKRYQEVYYK